MNTKMLLILLILTPIATASITINDDSPVTSTTIIPINITNGTYNLSVDNTTLILTPSNTSFNITDIKGYHNITIDNTTFFYLIYDEYPPILEIQNITPTSYHYTHLPSPTIHTSDPDNWSQVFIISQTPILSYPGNHNFTVTVSDHAGRYNTSSINYTVIVNTTANITQPNTLLLPLMNTSLTFTSTNPVNLSLTLPAGFTTNNLTYTNTTSVNFTIKSGIGPLDTFVTVHLSYIDYYDESGTLPIQYWLVGNKTVFYISYDSDQNAHISWREAMNATKTYYTTTSISPDRIKEMIAVYRNNQTYIK